MPRRAPLQSQRPTLGPADFARAAAVDASIRNAAERHDVADVAVDGTVKPTASEADDRPKPRNGIRSRAIFVHRSCRPLAEIDFDAQPALPGIHSPGGDGDDGFTNECGGNCGV